MANSTRGKNKIVRWGKIDDHRLDIYLDLAFVHFESFERTGIEYDWNERHTEAVAYALTYIKAPENMNAQLRVGSCDGVKVWLNGEKVWSNKLSRSAKIDEDVVSVKLSAGRNELLLKVANQETNDWGFYCRVTDANGKPIHRNPFLTRGYAGFWKHYFR